MTFTFHKGQHRALPLYWLRWWPINVSPSVLTRKVLFPFDAKYLLEDGDQDDHNKLFGLSFGRIHQYSVRFGWRYEPKKNVFIISAYCYRSGKRIMQDLCECVANHPYWFSILITKSTYRFMVTDEKQYLIADEIISSGHSRKLAFLLGPYFGGNKPSPLTLKINLSK